MDNIRNWKNKLNDIETVDDYMRFRDNIDLNNQSHYSNHSRQFSNKSFLSFLYYS